MEGRSGCQCGGSHDERELGVQYNLYEKIDLQNVECLNELIQGSGARVFKAWEERLDHSKFVESDVDEELLFNVPFTGDIKLKGIIIVGGPGDSHPSEVKLFKNRQGMTFDQSPEADQELELYVDEYGVHEYPVKVAKFSSMHHLSLHFTGNRGGAERTRIEYIGLKGEWSPGHRHGVTICTYEALPQQRDHVSSDSAGFSRQVS